MVGWDSSSKPSPTTPTVSSSPRPCRPTGSTSRRRVASTGRRTTRSPRLLQGLASLTDAAVETFGVGTVTRQIVEATNGWILVARISETAALGVVASAAADLGLVGYEMTMLAQRLGEVLSPALIDRLKNSVPLGR